MFEVMLFTTYNRRVNMHNLVTYFALLGFSCLLCFAQNQIHSTNSYQNHQQHPITTRFDDSIGSYNNPPSLVQVDDLVQGSGSSSYGDDDFEPEPGLLDGSVEPPRWRRSNRGGCTDTTIEKNNQVAPQAPIGDGNGGGTASCTGLRMRTNSNRVICVPYISKVDGGGGGGAAAAAVPRVAEASSGWSPDLQAIEELISSFVRSKQQQTTQEGDNRLLEALPNHSSSTIKRGDEQDIDNDKGSTAATLKDNGEETELKEEEEDDGETTMTMENRRCNESGDDYHAIGNGKLAKCKPRKKIYTESSRPRIIDNNNNNNQLFLNVRSWRKRQQSQGGGGGGQSMRRIVEEAEEQQQQQQTNPLTQTVAIPPAATVASQGSLTSSSNRGPIFLVKLGDIRNQRRYDSSLFNIAQKRRTVRLHRSETNQKTSTSKQPIDLDAGHSQQQQQQQQLAKNRNSTNEINKQPIMSAEEEDSGRLVVNDMAFECNRREYTFKATKQDASGNKCWGIVTAKICYGGCDTGEIADWLFPHKKSIHKVCTHGVRFKRRALLSQCNSENVDESLRDYHYIDAGSCVCRKCNSADTTCLGSLTRPYLPSMPESSPPSSPETQSESESGTETAAGAELPLRGQAIIY